MARMIMGAFATPKDADAAIAELESLGYSPGELSVISKNAKYSAKYPRTVGLGAVVGATTGGTLGGITGFLAGIGVVPVLAGLFIAGPITTVLGVAGITLTGALTGAAAGGLIGALTGLGLPRKVAETYQGAVDKGGVLIGLNEEGAGAEQVQKVLSRYGAKDVSAVDMPKADEKRYMDEPLVEDPRDYLVKHHMPVFGETLEDDYYEEDTF